MFSNQKTTKIEPKALENQPKSNHFHAQTNQQLSVLRNQSKLREFQWNSGYSNHSAFYCYPEIEGIKNTQSL